MSYFYSIRQWLSVSVSVIHVVNELMTIVSLIGCQLLVPYIGSVSALTLVGVSVSPCQWVSAFVPHCQWVSLVVFGCHWLSVGVSGCQWVSVGVRLSGCHPMCSCQCGGQPVSKAAPLCGPEKPAKAEFFHTPTSCLAWQTPAEKN